MTRPSRRGTARGTVTKIQFRGGTPKKWHLGTVEIYNGWITVTATDGRTKSAQLHCGDLANSGRSAGNYNSLPPHSAPVLTNITRTAFRCILTFGREITAGNARVAQASKRVYALY